MTLLSAAQVGERLGIGPGHGLRHVQLHHGYLYREDVLSWSPAWPASRGEPVLTASRR
jgi:hypothetical protein